MQQDRLFNRNYLIMCASTLLMFVAFYILMPIVAMYLTDVMGASGGMVGVVVASYVITALLARPFSGFLVDYFDRKRFLVVMLAIFASLCGGYLLARNVGELLITRILLGASFALTTTASSTLAIDVCPSSRRSEGISYYGAITVLSMAAGPMLGLYLIENFSYTVLFYIAVACCWLSFFVALFVRTKPREKIVREPLSFDRFFVRDGISMASVIAITYFLYGSLMAYMSLYVRESDVGITSATFFLLFAAGIIFSRLLTSKMLRRGENRKTLLLGLCLIVVFMSLLIAQLGDVAFACAALFIGGGFGMIGPAVQSLIVELVPHTRRGTANSTYFIALDMGSGLGMAVGGFVASQWSYSVLYILGTFGVVVALLFYLFFASGDYARRREKLLGND